MLRETLARASAILIAASVACSGSNSSEKDPAEVGALFVQVRDHYGVAVPGAELETDPVTETRFTDGAGTALFPHLGPGAYRLSATHDVAGVGADAVKVLASELTRTTITLDGSLGGQGGSTGGVGGTSGGTSGRGGSATGGTSGRGGGAGTGGGGTGGGPVGTFIDVGTDVDEMLLDPERPYLYALDSANNSFLFVNLDTQSVETTIFVGSTPVDMDFSEDGNEIFVANFGSTEIAVVDLEAQEVGRSIFVDTSVSTWDGNPYRLAVTAGGTLAYTSEDQWNDVKLVSSETGVHIATAGDIYEPDLTASPDRTKIYAAESGSTGSALHRFDVTETGITEVDTSGYSDLYGSRLAVTSGDGGFVFYAKQKILASNLQSVLGQYSEVIQASNADGTLVVGTTNVFDGGTFQVLGPLVVSSEVVQMSVDATTVYLFDGNTKRIYVQDLTDF